ncbi:MAG TPA: HAD-IA family hydrolase [Steroidobacteraceae bacterium]
MNDVGLVTDIGLVILDCDGVLVDSEIITNRVFAQMLGELGLTVTPDDMFERFVGQSMDRCCELIAAMLQAPVPVGFVAAYRERSNVALASQLQAVPGIEAALDAIAARGVPCCVASNGTHEKMRTTLGITGLLPRFEDRLFSVTEVAHGKPAPDLFLYAAGRNAVPPSRCRVIEDTPAGVAAAVAAGMPVYGFCARTSAQRLAAAGAQRTFDDMRALPGLLFGGGPRYRGSPPRAHSSR